MNQVYVLLGALQYEFRMQIRRPALWITLLLLETLLITLFFRFLNLENAYTHEDLLSHLDKYPLTDLLVQWAILGNRLLPIGAGVLLADRWARDRRTRVEELFNTTPGALSSRLFGKYLGSVLATLVPILGFYLLGVGYILIQTHNLLTLPLAIVVFAAVVLPGIIFISAFSIACPAIIWVPLYQFLFVGYWFWGNELGPRNGIPTLSRTILTPIGGYMVQGYFGVEYFYDKTLTVTPVQATESVLLLVGLALLVMFALWGYLRWQQMRS